MNMFFGIHVDPNSDVGMTLALLLSVVLAGLIGLEREFHGHPAGLRTHILVCLGATVATLVSARLATSLHVGGDPARIAAQVVAGVGFLGAGAIVREGVTVRGLTTAASTWSTAMIGIAVGAGPRLAELGVIATAVVLFTLWTLPVIDRWIDRRGRGLTTLVLLAEDPSAAAAAALPRLAERKVEVESISFAGSQQPGVSQIVICAVLLPGAARPDLLAALAAAPGVHSVAVQSRRA